MGKTLGPVDNLVRSRLGRGITLPTVNHPSDPSEVPVILFSIGYLDINPILKSLHVKMIVINLMPGMSESSYPRSPRSYYFYYFLFKQIQ